MLQQVTEINTSYGGGFVFSIQDISSTYSIENSNHQDWFFYVNGLLSPLGAAQYICHSKDIIRWEYHYWNDALATTAIIADFPEPFAHGYNAMKASTSIIYTSDVEQEARQLQKKLSEYDVDSRLVTVDELTENTKETENCILIGTYDVHPIIQEINNEADDLGLFITWDGHHVKSYDDHGALQQEYDNAGVIVAMQNHWNPKGNMHGENVIWMITGATHDDVQQACSILCEQTDQLQHATSAVVINNEVKKVP